MKAVPFAALLFAAATVAAAPPDSKRRQRERVVQQHQSGHIGGNFERADGVTVVAMALANVIRDDEAAGPAGPWMDVTEEYWRGQEFLGYRELGCPLPQSAVTLHSDRRYEVAGSTISGTITPGGTGCTEAGYWKTGDVMVPYRFTTPVSVNGSALNQRERREDNSNGRIFDGTVDRKYKCRRASSWYGPATLAISADGATATYVGDPSLSSTSYQDCKYVDRY